LIHARRRPSRAGSRHPRLDLRVPLPNSRRIQTLAT
jgi:hypothetical protein